MKRSAIFVFLILAAIVASASVTYGQSKEEISLTTIIPDQQVLRVKKGIVSTTNYDPSVFPDTSIPANSLLIEGNLGIGTTAPVAALDVTSVTSGAIPPRMTEAQRDAIDAGSPPLGTVIYNTDVNVLNLYNGAQWVSLGPSANDRIAIAGSTRFDNASQCCGGAYITSDGNLYMYSWRDNGVDGESYQSTTVAGPFVSVSIASGGAEGMTSTAQYFGGVAIKPNGDLYMYSWKDNTIASSYQSREVTGPFVSVSISAGDSYGTSYEYFEGAAIKSNDDLYLYSWYRNTVATTSYKTRTVTF